MLSCSSFTGEETEALRKKGFAEEHGLCRLEVRWTVRGSSAASHCRPPHSVNPGGLIVEVGLDFFSGKS